MELTNITTSPCIFLFSKLVFNVSNVVLKLVKEVSLFVNNVVKSVTILFIVVGICCAYQILVIYMNSKNVSPAHQSLVTALTNMIIMFFGSLFHISIGKIMHLCWEEQMIDNVVIKFVNKISLLRLL